MHHTFLTACLVAVPLAPASIAQEVLIGPAGTEVQQIVAARVDPLLAIAIHADGELLRTIDGGMSFLPADTAAAPGLLAAGFDAADTCYVASADRVLVSQDGAATFSIGAALPTDIVAFAASPHTGGEVWALLGDGDIYRSTNSAGSWSAVGALGMIAGSDFGIDAHPVNAGEWLVHTGQTLWHTTDSGASFSLDQDPFGPAQIVDATLLGTNWIVLAEDASVGVIQTEILTSSNQGASWNFQDAYSSVIRGRFRVSPSDPNEVWMGNFRESFLRSVDGGQTLTFPETSDGGYGVDIAFSSDPTRPAIIGTPTAIGTMDLTQFDFTAALGQGSSLPIISFAQDVRDPAHMVVATGGEIELYETLDGGSTWSELPLPGFSQQSAPDLAFDANGELWIARGRLYRFVAGAWQLRSPNNQVFAAAGSTIASETLYAVGRDMSRLELAVTRDGGQSWTYNTVCDACSIGADELWLIERSGASDRLVLQWDSGRRLEFSDDEGATWTAIGNPAAFDTFGGSPRSSERLAVWESGSLRTSDDGFANTSGPFMTNFGRGGIAVSSEDPSLLVGVRGNAPVLGISTDGGASWTERPDWAAGIDDIAAITLSVDERAVLVAGDTGLHRISLRDEASSSVCSQTVANSVGRFADIELVGSKSVAANDVRFEATGLPAYTLCLPIAADAFGQVPNAGGSVGTLCLAGQFGRFVPQAGPASASGAFGFQLDVNALPLSGAFVPATAGSRWLFQCWYRDVAGGVPTSHFTGAVGVVWE